MWYNIYIHTSVLQYLHFLHLTRKHMCERWVDYITHAGEYISVKEDVCAFISTLNYTHLDVLQLSLAKCDFRNSYERSGIFLATDYRIALTYFLEVVTLSEERELHSLAVVIELTYFEVPCYATVSRIQPSEHLNRSIAEIKTYTLLVSGCLLLDIKLVRIIKLAEEEVDKVLIHHITDAVRSWTRIEFENYVIA